MGFGDAGTMDDLAKMRRLVSDAMDSPPVVYAARELVTRAGANRDARGSALAIRDFLEHVWRYVDDPTDRELLRDPDAMLEEYARTGVITGDCDEAAVLGAALGRAVGLEDLFTVLAFDQGPARDQFAHVFAVLLTPAGELIDLDVTKPGGPVPAATRKLTVDNIGGAPVSESSRGTATMSPLAAVPPRQLLRAVMTPYDAGISFFPEYPWQRQPLGDYITDAALVGGTLATGGTGAAVLSAGSILVSAFTGGAAVDQQRQARVNYFLQQAESGNVAAAQLILGGPDNVSGNEKTMWVTAAHILASNPDWNKTLSEAQQNGPVWLVGSGDTATNYPAMKAFTAAWAAQHQSVPAQVAGAVSSGAAAAAKSPVTPWIIGGLGVAALVLLTRKPARR